MWLQTRWMLRHQYRGKPDDTTRQLGSQYTYMELLITLDCRENLLVHNGHIQPLWIVVKNKNNTKKNTFMDISKQNRCLTLFTQWYQFHLASNIEALGWSLIKMAPNTHLWVADRRTKHIAEQLAGLLHVRYSNRDMIQLAQSPHLIGHITLKQDNKWLVNCSSYARRT